MTSLTNALVIHPVLRENDYVLREPEGQLQEVIGLAEAININPIHAELAKVQVARPATLLGEGKVGNIREFLETSDEKIELVILDCALSPVQHRNLEKAWNAKVLDRTALILEIFGARAKTKEGRLQVELAHLIYQRSRLVRSWTHLERQRGGAGFLGGPGERQIESDRRILAEKVAKLRRQLEDVRRTRNLQRRKRKRAPHPVVALVGYTNAGKSTLFNNLTDASVMAEDQLFATLDPTMRAVDLPSATRVIFSDTVGFISNLPTQLIAAFRATLEEVLEADIILHVRDASHQESDAQKADVLSVLSELGIEDDQQRPVIEVWNKTDLLNETDLTTLLQIIRAKNENAEGVLSEPWIVPVSALKSSGLNALYAKIDEVLTIDHQVYLGLLKHTDGAATAWLHAHGEVINTSSQSNGQLLQVRLSQKAAGQFEKQFDVRLATDDGVNNSITA